jgi:hypothetical protein
MRQRRLCVIYMCIKVRQLRLHAIQQASEQVPVSPWRPLPLRRGRTSTIHPVPIQPVSRHKLRVSPSSRTPPSTHTPKSWDTSLRTRLGLLPRVPRQASSRRALHKSSHDRRRSGHLLRRRRSIGRGIISRRMGSGIKMWERTIRLGIVVMDPSI